MKSCNREINVFSMSALDLFASALGAFILIPIVLSRHKVSTAYEYTDSSRGGTAEFLRRLAEAGNGNFTGSGGSFTSTMLFALAGL